MYADRISATLGDDISDARIREIVRDFYVMLQEDRWGRWQAIRSPEWTVTTEVEGMQHLRAAQERGRGAILWGISFCGTLFNKIALANAGVELNYQSVGSGAGVRQFSDMTVDFGGSDAPMTDDEFALVSSPIDPVVPNYDAYVAHGDWLNETWQSLLTA